MAKNVIPSFFVLLYGEDIVSQDGFSRVWLYLYAW